jgi:hypothetical protein
MATGTPFDLPHHVGLANTGSPKSVVLTFCATNVDAGPVKSFSDDLLHALHAAG